MARVARQFPRGRYVLRTPTVVDEDALYPVYLYYFCGGKQLRHSTSIFTTVKNWNPNAKYGIGELRASFGSDYIKKNRALQKKLCEIDGCIYDYVEQNGSITPDIIQSFISGDQSSLRADKGLDFTAFAMDLLAKQYGAGSIRISTYQNSVSIINQFKEYMNVKTGKNDEVYVGDITEDLVRGFLAWSLDRGRKRETVAKYKETISKICRHASEQGLLPKASAISITTIKMNCRLDDDAHEAIKYLTIEELGKLRHYNSDSLTKRQSEFIEMFFFAFYSCGLRISDVITLKWCNIDFKNKKLFKVLVKSRNCHSIPLREEALNILETWKGQHKTFVFGLLPDDFDLKNEEKLLKRRNSITSTINHSLQRVSEKLNLSQKVTFHMARHSWAVSALEQGMPMPMISSLMGHASIGVTTKVYAQYVDGTKAGMVSNLHFNI